MNKNFALVSLAALAALASVNSRSADNGFYAGVGVGRTNYDFGDSFSDTKDTALKAIAGFRLLDSFGLEADYVDHGKLTEHFDISPCLVAPCTTTLALKARTAAAFAVGFLDFPVVDLFAKAGLSYGDATLRSSASGPTVVPVVKDTGTEFAWGVGAQAHFLSFAVRAEFERYKVFDRSLDTYSASVLYTFF